MGVGCDCFCALTVSGDGAVDPAASTERNFDQEQTFRIWFRLVVASSKWV